MTPDRNSPPMVAEEIAVISFDLQGTLSDSAFSDEFWLTLLPELYAEHNHVSVVEAKAALKEHFRQVGKYHRHYYCARTWLAELCPGQTVVDMLARLKNQPHLYEDSLALLREFVSGGKEGVKPPLIILSTTTHDFIELELSKARPYFSQIFSTLDDFNLPGKSAEAFREAARRMNVKPEQILHIGDCAEMDVKNGSDAGCRTFFFDKREPRGAVIARLQSTLSALSSVRR